MIRCPEANFAYDVSPSNIVRLELTGDVDVSPFKLQGLVQLMRTLYKPTPVPQITPKHPSTRYQLRFKKSKRGPRLPYTFIVVSLLSKQSPQAPRTSTVYLFEVFQIIQVPYSDITVMSWIALYIYLVMIGP